jgi:hypothetical protein
VSRGALRMLGPALSLHVWRSDGEPPQLVAARCALRCAGFRPLCMRCIMFYGRVAARLLPRGGT